MAYKIIKVAIPIKIGIIFTVFYGFFRQKMSCFLAPKMGGFTCLLLTKLACFTLLMWIDILPLCAIYQHIEHTRCVKTTIDLVFEPHSC